MEIKDLRIGDVLLFSPEKGSFISWAITFLTDAPVSHAALYYGQKDDAPSIIEETPPAVAINPAATRFVDRTITVRRLSSDLPLNPVIDAAQKYFNTDDPYDSAGLYMVGLILVYKKFTPSTPVQQVVIKILKRITATLDAYINSHKYPGQLPMVCSQFVAQCYEDAGPAYQLKFQDGVLMGAERGASLLDQALSFASETPVEYPRQPTLTAAAADTDPSVTDEQLCQELQEAFSQQGLLAAPARISGELVEAMHQFSYVNARFLTGDKDLADRCCDRVASSLSYLKSNENMFVVPGDLLLHCPSLQDAGVIG